VNSFSVFSRNGALTENLKLKTENYFPLDLSNVQEQLIDTVLAASKCRTQADVSSAGLL
jgi:hypothetical protein